jgi:hypothetical protein
MANTSELAGNPFPGIMLIGDNGTHKTYFAGTCPKPYIFDFDKNLTILRGKSIEYDTFRDAPNGSKVHNPELGIYPYGTGWSAFIKRLNEIGQQIEDGECPFQTLVFDSLTFAGNLALNYVKKETNFNHKDPVDQGRWGMQSGLLETVLDQLTSWPVIKVCVCHIQRDTNQVTQSMEKLPLLTGKFAAKAPGYFSEVYFTDVESKGANGEQKFVLRTKQTTVLKCAKSPLGVPDGSETAWSSVEKALSAKMV